MQIKEKTLQLNPRQLSLVIALLILTSFFIFIIGYYCGKSSSSNPIEISAYDSLSLNKLEENTLAVTYLSSEKNLALDSVLINRSEEDRSKNKLEVQKEGPEWIAEHEAGKAYYGQLAGFGSLKFAKKCEENLKAYGYAVKTIEKIGKTNKGDSRTWYQVVTEPEKDKDVLLKKIKEIKKIAKIKKDVIVVAVNEKQQKAVDQKERRLA